MVTRQKKKLKVVKHPGIGHILDAPPPLIASTHTIDYTCGGCGEVLLHADDGQVHNVLIRCNSCGCYNKTEG